MRAIELPPFTVAAITPERLLFVKADNGHKRPWVEVGGSNCLADEEIIGHDDFTVLSRPKNPKAHKLVFVAGPYTNGDVVENVRCAIEVGEDIERFGYDVFIPHLTMLWHLVSPAPIERWYERDRTMVPRCDALYRIDGESTGADAEVAAARELGVPVFDHYADLLQTVAP